MLNNKIISLAVIIFTSAVIFTLSFVIVFRFGEYIPWVGFVNSGLQLGILMKFGLFVAIIHGFFTAFFIYLRKSDTLFSFCLSSFFATELVIIFSSLVFWIIFLFTDLFKHITDPVYQIILRSIFRFLIFSFLFFIPSVIIGIINKKGLSYIKNSNLLR